MEEEKKVKKSSKNNVEINRNKKSVTSKTDKIEKSQKPVKKTVKSSEKTQDEKKVAVAAIKPKTVTKVVRNSERVQAEKKVTAIPKKTASVTKSVKDNNSGKSNEKIEARKNSVVAKKKNIEDKKTKEEPKVKATKKAIDRSKVQRASTGILREEFDDILGETFESSSKAVNDAKSTHKTKSSTVKNSEKKDDVNQRVDNTRKVHKKTDLRDSITAKRNVSSVAQKNASSEAKRSASSEVKKNVSSAAKKNASSEAKKNVSSTARKNASSGAKKIGTSKAASVKRRITEEVSKAVSEKSSKIKIKNNKNVTKEDIEKITTNIENEKEVEKEEKVVSIDELNLQEIDEELYLRKSLPKDVFTKILVESSLSVVYVIGFLVFLIFNNYGYHNIAGTSFMSILKASSFLFLGTAIVLFEISFKKESASKCVIGIETLLFAILTLSLPYIYQIYHGTFTNLLKSVGIAIFGYSIVKACITFYNKQNRYFREQENLVIEDDDNEFNDDDEDEE